MAMPMGATAWAPEVSDPDSDDFDASDKSLDASDDALDASSSLLDAEAAGSLLPPLVCACTAATKSKAAE
ncbi:hypothetical protein IW147_000878 [Coemansia sp. RSA 720]|nr:hypothetical protein IW147_000878 [Coemansia sp. RSA 720]